VQELRQLTDISFRLMEGIWSRRLPLLFCSGRSNPVDKVLYSALRSLSRSAVRFAVCSLSSIIYSTLTGMWPLLHATRTSPLQAFEDLSVYAMCSFTADCKFVSYGSNDGGTSVGPVPHCLFGVVPSSKSSVPPCSTKLSGSHVLLVDLPFTLRLCT